MLFEVNCNVKMSKRNYKKLSFGFNFHIPYYLGIRLNILWKFFLLFCEKAVIFVKVNISLIFTLNTNQNKNINFN